MGGANAQLQIDTKLHEAVRFSQIEDVRVALQQGYDPNLIGVYMWSPLHEAACNGDKHILQLLLLKKGDPNKKDFQRGRTATHYAAENGHIECLKLLVNAGAKYDIKDDDDKDCLDVVTPGGRKILEKLKMRDLMFDPDDDKDEGISTDRSHDQTSLSSSRRSSIISQQEEGPVLGHIHLSVEYHAAKGSLKIRIWQLSDLLLPPPNTSMIHSIYVKSYLRPDKKRETKRKTEEVKVDSSKGFMHWNKKKELSVKHVFTPANFKFSQPLEYSGITHDIVKEKQVEIEVCVTQRYSRRSYLIGMVRMSLRSAVKKLKKERLVIIPCMNHTIPSSMKVYCASELDIVNNSPGGNYFFSSPNVRIVLPEDADDSSDKAASNPDLQPWKHYSPSVEVDMNQKFDIVPNIPKLDLNITPLDESGYSSEFHVSMHGELESPDSDSSKNSFVRLHEKNVGLAKVHEPLKKVKPTHVLENIIEHNLHKTESDLGDKAKSDVKLEITDLDDPELSEVHIEKDWGNKHEKSKVQTIGSDSKSDEESSNRPDTLTWDYYDIPTEVVSQELAESTTPWKEGAAPVVLPMETTLGLIDIKDQNVGQKIKKDRSLRHSKKKQNKSIPGKAVPLLPSIVVTNAERDLESNRTVSSKETKIAIPSEVLREVKDNEVRNVEESKIYIDPQDKGAIPKTKSLLKKVDRKMFVNVGKTISKDKKGSTEILDETGQGSFVTEQNRPKLKPKFRKTKKSQELDLNKVSADNGEYNKKVKVPPLDFSFKNREPVHTGSSKTGSSVVVDMDKLSMSAASAHVVELIEDDISITELNEGDQLFTDRSEVSMSAFTDIESGLGDYHIPERVSPTKYMIPMQVYDVDDTSCDESITTDRSYVPTTVL